MKKIIVLLLFWCSSQTVFSQAANVYVETTNSQMKLKVNGKDFMINGMNWDYFPIGTNYNYSLWKQSDDVIKAALDSEMSLLKNMGVNAIRQYTGVPPKWIQYIYEKFGNAYFSEQTKEFIAESLKIKQSLNHRPSDQKSIKYLEFQRNLEAKIKEHQGKVKHKIFN